MMFQGFYSPSYQLFPQLCLFPFLFFLLFLTPSFPVHWLTREQPTGAGAPVCHGVLSAFLPREAGAEEVGGSWGSHCEVFCFMCILRPYSQHKWEVDRLILTWMNKKKSPERKGTAMFSKDGYLVLSATAPCCTSALVHGCCGS